MPPWMPLSASSIPQPCRRARWSCARRACACCRPEPNQQISQTDQDRQPGQGYLRGEITSTQPWVKAGAAFSCPPGPHLRRAHRDRYHDLMPGQSLGGCDPDPGGGQPEVVAVQVMVTGVRRRCRHPPAIEVSPSRVDFGTVAADELSTPQSVVTVTNTEQGGSRVRSGSPPWLLVKPETLSSGPPAPSKCEVRGARGQGPGAQTQGQLLLPWTAGKIRS